MNKQIEGLWWQAQIGYNNQNCDPEVLAKFAQLIVRECLYQADEIRDDLESDGEDQQALGADWAGLAIARHFGVEE